MFNTIWEQIKARKHYCISWFLLLMTIAHFGENIESSWYKFFSIFAILLTVEYYTWAYKENK